MQIKPAVTHQCPFLLESDVLSLSSDFRLSTNRALEDCTVGVKHAVQTAAQPVLAGLASGISVEELRQQAQQNGVAELPLAELLGFLNIIGALGRTRLARQWPTALFLHLRQLTMGIYYPSLAWRRPAKPAYVLLGIIRACTLLIIATALLAAFVASSGVLPVGQTTLAALFGLATFLCSLYVHEAAHVVLIRGSGTPAAVLQKGLRLGILHRPLPARAEISSALAGPAAGLATGLVAAAVVLPVWPLLALLGVLIGTFHLAGLLPWYGDGSSLRQALRQKGSAYESA